MKTYKLLQDINVKLDGIIKNDATTMATLSRTYTGLSGVGNNVQNTVSVVEDIQNQIGSLTDVVSKAIPDEKPTPVPTKVQMTANTVTGNTGTANNGTANNGTANNGTANNGTGNNGTENNGSNIAEGGRRNRSQKAHKKGRRTHKRR